MNIMVIFLILFLTSNAIKAKKQQQQQRDIVLIYLRMTNEGVLL